MNGTATRVLLTGAAGFVGRHLAEALRAAGCTVIGAGRSAPRANSCDEFICCDLLAPAARSRLIERAGADTLAHLAWCTEHGRYRDDPANERWQAASVALVEQYLAAGGRHVVATGSCAEYIWDERECDEADPDCSLARPYERAKHGTRAALAMHCARAGATFAWARLFFLYGAGEDERRLVPAVMDALAWRRAPFALQAEAQRDYLHVADVASGLAALACSRAAGTFNVCSGAPVALREIVRAAACLIDADPAPLLVQPLPAQPRRIAGRNARLRALGWAPRVNLACGLAACARTRGLPDSQFRGPGGRPEMNLP
ncbi:MAG: NAD-dependent epimerase/dehydratase family protein [Betaproteobacteria bacterium]